MSKPEPEILRLLKDPDYFRAAVSVTAETTTFAPRLVEKDCLCSLLLEYLAPACPELVFKGGTCLSKVHADFYRLSEDLDFVIPMPQDAARSERSKRSKSLKAAVAALTNELPVFRLAEPLKGANNSTQYNAVFGYRSVIDGREETIKVEVGLREPLLLATISGQARTLILNPLSRTELVKPLALPSIAKPEAFAEKFRAALSRREVAVRDFFDLDYAVRKLGLKEDNQDLAGMLRKKLAVRGNDPVDVSEHRWSALRQQVGSELQPVLRVEDFAAFDVERAIRIVTGMAARL